MRATFDHQAFVEALERAREARGLSWNQVAVATDLEPSTLYRIVAGSVPALPRFAALIDWLDLPADNFVKRSTKPRMELLVSTGQRISVKLPEAQPLNDQQVQGIQSLVESVLEAWIREGAPMSHLQRPAPEALSAG